MNKIRVSGERVKRASEEGRNLCRKKDLWDRRCSRGQSVRTHSAAFVRGRAHTHKQTNAHTDTRDLFKCQPHKMEIKHPAPLFADKKTLALSVSPSSFCWGKLLFECLLFCSLSCLLPLSVCWPLWEVNRNTDCSVFLYRIIAGTQC